MEVLPNLEKFSHVVTQTYFMPEWSKLLILCSLAIGRKLMKIKFYYNTETDILRVTFCAIV